MTKVSMNGRNLHEVKMRGDDSITGCISYLSYPEHRIKTEIVGDKIIIKLPPLLALELYHSAIIPQNEEEAFPVKLGGKDFGLFCVIDLRYPLGSDSNELISITLTRIDDDNTTDGV